MTTERYKVLIDQTIPTNRQIRERRPDVVLIDRRDSSKIKVCDVACAWEPLVLERERKETEVSGAGGVSGVGGGSGGTVEGV